MTDQRQRFALRKYGVGLASVLIGLTFMWGGTTVHAATPTNSANNMTSTTGNVEINHSVTTSTDASSARSLQDQTSQPSQTQSSNTTVSSSGQKQQMTKDVTQPTQTSNLSVSNQPTKSTTSTTNDTRDQGTQQQTLKLTSNQVTSSNANPFVSLYQAPSYNVNDWQYTTNSDGTGITLTKYTGSGTEYNIPNAAAFRTAGKITTGQKVYATFGFLNSLYTGNASWGIQGSTNGPATSISIERADDANDKVVLVGYDGTPSGGTPEQANELFGGGNRTDAESGNTTLKTLDLAGLDVSNIRNMSNMFSDNKALTSVTGLDTWDVRNVTNGIGHMFAFDDNLTTVEGLNGWDTSNIPYIDNMFIDDAKLTGNIDLSRWDTSKVYLANDMFNGASSLTSVGDLSGWDLSNAGYTENMFLNASKITNLGNLANWSLKNDLDASSMFQGTTALTNVGDLSSWRLPKVTNTSFMFQGAHNLKDLGNLNNWGMGKDTDMDSMFAQMYSLTNIGNIGSWDVSNVTSMNKLFDTDYQLTTPGDLSNWDVSKVTNMGQMFRVHIDQTGSTPLYFGKNVTINGHDYKVGALSSVGDLSRWDVSNVKYMAGMFEGTSLNNIGDLSKWNTDNVVDMDYMFQSTPYLTSVGDLSKWNQSGKLQATYCMFEASGVKQINVSGWKFSVSGTGTTSSGINGTSNQGHARIYNMFLNLENPATITANDWSTALPLQAGDFDGNQPLIVLSNNLSAMNNETVSNGKGHPTDTVTFVDVGQTSQPVVASQQQNFVYASQDALKKTLTAIPTTDNLAKINVTIDGASHKLSDEIVPNSGAYLNGKHNATGTDYGNNNYGNIAGTYSVNGNVDVTKTEKKDPVTSTFHIIERGYPGGDKTILTITTTQYKHATKNSFTGKITYGKYEDASGVGLDPDNSYTMSGNNFSYGKVIGHPEETDITEGIGSYDPAPDGYTINLNEDTLPDKNNPNGTPLHIKYHQTNHTYSFDIYWGEQPLDSFPKSADFYIDYDHPVKFQFIDTDNNNAQVGADVTKNGYAGETLTNLGLKVPAGYNLATGQTLPTSQKVTDDKD